MSWETNGSTSSQRVGTMADVIEAIDRTAPATKAELAADLGLSEHYLSELLQELKGDDLVRKAYVVDRRAVFEAAPSVSEFRSCGATEESDRDTERLFDLLRGLDEATANQYDAAGAAFGGDEPEPSADTLEPLTNERYFTVLEELKSLTIRSDWPGNRIAADLAIVAQNMEIVGDRACFIANAIDAADADPRGIVHDRVCAVFDGGERIHDHLAEILFAADLERVDALYEEERQVHRTLDELFELVTAYDPSVYGHLVAVTRALERAIHYWVNAAEIAVRLHTGLDSTFPLTVE